MQDFVSNLSCFLLLACSLARLLRFADRFAFCVLLFFAHARMCCSVGKGKRGAGKGERNSRGTENLGHTLPSTLQERNRIHFAFSQSSGAFNTQRKLTCTTSAKQEAQRGQEKKPARYQSN